MGRPKLSDAEKQWRKEQQAKERDRVRADKKAFDEQMKLRSKRSKALKKLAPHWHMDIEWCTADSVGLVVSSNEVNYDRLLELSLLFDSTDINIGSETTPNGDTFGSYDEPKMTISIANAKWKRLDLV